MKVAVYAIAKNEATHVERFLAAANEADIVVVVDTGSTDDTVDLLRAGGAVVWREDFSRAGFRFDEARNLALSLVPTDADLCVSLDLDEVPEPGWRERIEEAWLPGTTALTYMFHWSHHANGAPDISFWAQKVHARAGYHWEYPVHEVIVADIAEVVRRCGMVVHHYADPGKSRSSYLPLLELSAKERPDNHRAALYLGREYMYAKMWSECAKELKRYLALPSATWYLERAAAMRFIARAEERVPLEKVRWLLRACGEAPDQREPWVDLAQAYHDFGNWSGGYYAAKMALSIERRPASYLTEAYAWGERADDLAAVCAWNMDLKSAAREHIARAHQLCPDDNRITANMVMMAPSRLISLAP